MHSKKKSGQSKNETQQNPQSQILMPLSGIQQDLKLVPLVLPLVEHVASLLYPTIRLYISPADTTQYAGTPSTLVSLLKTRYRFFSFSQFPSRTYLQGISSSHRFFGLRCFLDPRHKHP